MQIAGIADGRLLLPSLYMHHHLMTYWENEYGADINSNMILYDIET
jgi:hypothetical protein